MDAKYFEYEKELFGARNNQKGQLLKEKHLENPKIDKIVLSNQ